MSRLPFDLGLRPESDPAALPDPSKSSFRWATVVNVCPLSIRLDGETVPLDARPSTIAGGVTPGDRVWTQLHGRQVVILGRGGQQPRQFWAASSGTTDAAGDLTVEHGQGWAPSAVMLTPSGPNDNLSAPSASMTDTEFVVHVKDNSGAAAGSKLVHFQYLMLE